MNSDQRHDGVRPRFCFLLASVHTGASVDLWRGVAQEAEDLDIDLLILPAGRLGAREDFEYMRNGLAGLIRPDACDGLLSWASSLSGECGPDDVQALHEGFGPIPTVSLAQRVGQAPMVSLDAYGGMRSILDHLSDMHGFERIAFLRGPERHSSAADRYRAYLDFLDERGIAFDEALVSSPLPWDSGGRAIDEFLDERGLVPGESFQAVAAASDFLAFWFLRGLQDRGFQVPADLAVTGFNDSPESQLLSPPLTTVAMPFREQGKRGLSLLLDLWQGAGGAADKVLPVSLVVRESCGCPSGEVELAGPGTSDVRPSETAPAGNESRTIRIERTVEAAAQAARADDRTREAWIRPLVHAFVDQERAGGGRFLDILGRILDRLVHEDGPGLSWQNVISVLDKGIHRLWDRPNVDGPRALLAQARVMIGQAAGRRSTFRLWTAEEAAKRLRSLGRGLLTTYTIAGIAARLAERLPDLDIRHAYLVLAPVSAGAKKRLVLALRDGRREDLPPDGIEVESAAAIPAEYLPQGRYSLVLEPLFVNEEALGCLALDAGAGKGIVYEELRGFVSAAVKGAALFSQAADARAQAERADRLKTRLLANVSHELRTPLNLIVDEARALDPAIGRVDYALLSRGLARIADHARYQSSVVNDLLDLSRAEIEEIDLAREYTDPGPLARDCLESFLQGVSLRKDGTAVEWELDIAGPLPLVYVDPVRVKQILLNLLENARKHTERGGVRLSVRALSPWLAMEVLDTGRGLPAERLSEVFEPFFTDGDGGGVGLGLAISRHLAALHGGRLEAESAPGAGSRFTLFLPLPRLGREAPPTERLSPYAIVLGHGDPDSEVLDSLRAQGCEIRGPGIRDAEVLTTEGPAPRALVLDPATMDAASWALLRRMRRNPRLLEAPVLLFETGRGAAARLQGAAISPREAMARLLDGRDEDLLSLLGAPILVVDDDASHRSRMRSFFEREFAGISLVEAARGDEALTVLAERVPVLVILDLALPGASGEDILSAMKSDERLRHVPVIVLTGKSLGEEELMRLDRHSRIIVQTKGIWKDEEFGRIVRLALRDEIGSGGNPAVKKALAWIFAHYGGPFTRTRLAEEAGTNEDHLSRLFHRELGIGMWDFLNRYRMRKARELLSATSLPIGDVAARVGFADPSYFCRVFRKICGTTPQAYRDGGTSR